MSELAKVERDIATLRESIRLARLAIADPGLTPEARSQERASVDLYERHLAELLIERDDLRSLAED